MAKIVLTRMQPMPRSTSYSPQNDPDQGRASDENLRAKHISDEELQDLKKDYDEHYGGDLSISSDDRSDTTIQLFKTLRRSRPSFDSEEEREWDESNQEHHHRRNSQDLENALDGLIQDLQDLDEPEEEIRKVLQQDERQQDSEEEVNTDEGSVSSNETNDVANGQSATLNNDDDSEESASSELEVSPKKLRSGKVYSRAYFQNGIKMQPTHRPNSDKVRRHQLYLKRKKPKSNSQKNRSAMRRKARIEKNRASLHQMLHLRNDARKKDALPDVGPSGDIDEGKYNLLFQQISSDRKSEYSVDKAWLIATYMQEIREKVQTQGTLFIQQHYLNKGLKLFGDKGKEAIISELDQLVQQNCWTPVHVKELTKEEKQKSVDTMMLLAQKHSGKIKGHCVYKGNETRDWLTHEETASPTASLEAITLTSVIDAYEECDVMTADIPNAFIQTCMPEPKEGEARVVVMRITGMLVDYMVEIDPTYCNYIVFD